MNEWEWHLLEDKPALESVEVGNVQVRPGSRVRLRPRVGGDVLDIALAGKIATIEAIEQDYEGQVHLSVVVDEDPGHDIGMMRQPGHRFFFSTTDVEPLDPSEAEAQLGSQTPTILVAGIGNIFLGDDGFGVEVAKRASRRAWPGGVRVVDFGIRGLDLAYALVDGADVTILVDACPRGGSPGDLYVVEPDLNLRDDETESAGMDAHSMNPISVIRVAQRMGAARKKILLLGCEPQTLGPEEGCMDLSEPVTAAVDRAVTLLEALVKQIMAGDGNVQGTSF